MYWIVLGELLSSYCHGLFYEAAIVILGQVYFLEISSNKDTCITNGRSFVLEKKNKEQGWDER